MVSLWTVGVEASALGAALLSLPLRLVRPREQFHPEAPHPTPVVLIHGFLGDPSNFLVLRRYLEARGIQNLYSFSYPPRLDYPREAARLRTAIAEILAQSGFPAVDMIGHSLGGLVARHYVATEGRASVRRLITLGTPHLAAPPEPDEIAIFAAHDAFVEPPAVDGAAQPREAAAGNGIGSAAAGGGGPRMIIVPHCGHWGLLYHPTVLREVARCLMSAGSYAQAQPPPAGAGAERPGGAQGPRLLSRAAG